MSAAVLTRDLIVLVERPGGWVLALLAVAAWLSAVYLVVNWIGVKVLARRRPHVRLTPPYEWRLTPEEMRAKELRLIAARDARRSVL